jgi:hypothetical protein
METEKERRAPKGGFSGRYDEIVSLHPAAWFVNFFQAQTGAEQRRTTVHY